VQFRGFPHPTWAEYREGRALPPSARILRKIAKPLGFDEAELLTHAGFLPLSLPLLRTRAGVLDPYVARLLSQEPIKVQRTLIGLLSILKSIARVKS